MEEAVKGVVPRNTCTEKNNEWAWKNFLDWRSTRSEKLPSDPVPRDLLSSSDPNLLCKWLVFLCVCMCDGNSTGMWKVIPSQDSVCVITCVQCMWSIASCMQQGLCLKFFGQK